MRVVSVINYKGGVGKTTLTANLGAELAVHGARVLLIDLDPQASLTFSFLTPEAWQRDFAASRTIKAWFEAGEAGALASLAYRPEGLNGTPHLRASGGVLALICSHLSLLSADMRLAMGLAGATPAEAQRNFLRIHRRLAEGIAAIPDGDYDFVLIDCPPSFNLVTRTAVVASDAILIPARPDYLSTLGIQYLLRELGELVGEHNRYAAAVIGVDAPPIQPNILGVVFTMVEEYAGKPIAAQRGFMAQVERLGVPVFAAHVRHSPAVFGDAPTQGVPVALREYRTPAGNAVVRGIEEIAVEFRNRLGG